MADVITRLKVESSEYDSKIKRATQSLNEMTTAAEREGNKIATANKENIALAQSLGKMATVSTTARGKMSELSAAIESATIQYNRLSQAEKQGQFGKALNASITQLQGRLKGLQTEMAAVQGQLATTTKMSLGAQFGQGFKSAAMMFGPQALAIGATVAAIGGMKKVVGDMISINQNFDQGTANLAAVMGKTTEEVSSLTQQAKQLGATTRYTAQEILELQTNLARLGFTQQEILNSTTAVQAFATATGADLGEAANLAGAALRGFGLNATEMERVASVMAVSTTKSALSFEKLATAVPIVAPVAKQFGFTIEDTVTLLGKLSDAGMDASSAATATRNIFLKMADGSGKLSQAMGRPVHSVEEFGEALKEMKEKGMDLNDILNMVGVRSTAAFAVFADNAGTLKDFKDSITDVSEEMHDMEDKQINTLQGSLKLLASAWDGLMMTFNNNGPIKAAVDLFTDLLNAWTDFRKRNAGGEEAISTYAEGLTAEKQKAAQATIEGMRRGGASFSDVIGKSFIGEYQYEPLTGMGGGPMSDEEILNKFKQEKEALEEEEKELRKVQELYEKYKKLQDSIAGKRFGGASQQGKQARELMQEIQALGYGKSLNYNGELQDIYKRLASIEDKKSVKDYQMSILTPAPETEDPEGKGGQGDMKLLAAQYKEKEKAEIAALKRMEMNEAEYEEAVYNIKKTWLQKTADLYNDGTDERARANAAISQLDIQYQGTQMRLANKKSPQETAEEKVSKALEDYATTMNIAKIRMDAGLDDEATYKAKELAAHERLFDAYTEAYNLYADPKYKEAYDKEAEAVLDLAKTTKELKDAKEAQKQAEQQAKQLDSSILRGLTGTAKKAGWTAEDLGTVGIKTQIEAGVDITEDQWNEFVDKLNERLKELKMDPIQINFETGEIEKPLDAAKKDMTALTKNVDGAINAFSQLGGAMQQIEDPSAKVAGIIMGAIAEVAGSFAASLKGTFTPWDWIAASIAGVSTMISTIAAIKSATSGGYANGGVIPGNSFSGDNMRGILPNGDLVGLDAGEIILNRAQQGVVAGAMQGNPMNDLNLGLEVEGTKMLLLLNNTNRSLGGSRSFYTNRH